MAKISARGATKVAEAHYDITLDDGSITRRHLVLTSDGRILGAFSTPGAELAYDRRRSGYNVLAKIRRVGAGQSDTDIFKRYAHKRACGRVVTFLW